MIGAGLVGFAAADALAAEDLEMDVLEARNRVGGRVWSDRLATGALIERGGEFLTDGFTATERAIGRIVFAGEHTSPDWSGSIEGALPSGERAAAEVLRLVPSP